jgi:hypothetical protein
VKVSPTVTDFFHLHSLTIGVGVVVAIGVIGLTLTVVHSCGRRLNRSLGSTVTVVTVLLAFAFVADVIGRYRAFS